MRSYSQEDKDVWAELFARQYSKVKDHVPDEFIMGIEKLELSSTSIPSIDALNELLLAQTGFQIIEVEEVSKPRAFFKYLSEGKFPVRSHVRPREEIESVDWPDLFHEVFGHAPFLCNQGYADFLRKFGEIGNSLEKESWWQLFRLSWHTIEFGLIKEKTEQKIYGAGILSAMAEVDFINRGGPEVCEFDLMDALRTPYKIEFPQPKLFYINSFADLGAILDDDVVDKIRQARQLGDLKQSENLSI